MESEVADDVGAKVYVLKTEREKEKWIIRSLSCLSRASCTPASGAQPLVPVQEVVGLAAALLLLSAGVVVVKAQVVVEAEELTCLGHVQEADSASFSVSMA